MRIKITALSQKPVFFPYNHIYSMHSALYALMEKSSASYSAFLHDQGYVKKGIDKIFKLFTFSKLRFYPKKQGKGGFYDVKEIQFVFSTIMEKSMQHLILGIFADQEIIFHLDGGISRFGVSSIDIQDEPRFTGREKFFCLSPIAVSTVIVNDLEKKIPHFLDYTNPLERPHFIQNLKKNLLNKYETIHDIPYPSQDMPFNFHFDEEYIARKHGKISKLMEFKNQIKIKAMEAPFFIEADSELIRIGYECGWGEKNSAGFGCVDILEQ